MQYVVQTIGSENRDQFTELAIRFPSAAFNREIPRRDWWCYDNPYDGAFSIVPANHEIAATCYVSGKRLSLGGMTVPAFEIGETATEPAHQRKGLFSKLVKSSVAYGFKHGAEVIYGTPNSQSTPGYSKLGFEIVTDDRSVMLIALNVFHWMPVLEKARRMLKGINNFVELSPEQYIQITCNFRRLHVSTTDYLQWRFSKPSLNYRFFQIKIENNTYLCALKPGFLGKYSFLICSECFYNGEKPSTRKSCSFVKRAAAENYNSAEYVGIQIHCEKPSFLKKVFLSFRAVIFHRNLPICFLAKSPGTFRANWFENFQLSDCDIG